MLHREQQSAASLPPLSMNKETCAEARPESSSTHLRLVYDRGTIRLEGESSAIEEHRLPGVLWDPRVAVFRAPAYRYRDLIQALRAQGVVFIDRVSKQGQDVIRLREPRLRSYQADALRARAEIT